MQLHIYGTFLALVTLAKYNLAMIFQIEDHLQCLQSKNILDLSNSNTTSISANFFSLHSNFHDAFCLNLQNNMIEFISPIALKMLKNLEYLNLANNNLQKRNLDFVESAKNLKTLVADKVYRSYTDRENEFYLNLQSTSLESLYLRYNNIENLIITSDFQPMNLKKLVLSDNNIVTINYDRNGLLSDAKFDWLPSSLEYLHIENNKLTDLTLVNMSCLLEVHAKQNPLETLVLENLSSLRSLLISELFLNKISIKNLSKLEDLALEFDKTEELFLSDINGLPSLVTLEVEGRNLVFFDGQIIDNMPSLESFFLAGSKLSLIPRIQNGTQLSYLILPKNQIESLSAKDFCGMPNLMEINLSDNSIRELMPHTFTDLKNLRILNLEKNLLKFISYSAFEPLCTLNKLYLAQNTISFFDGNIVDKNPYLKEIYLRDNFLQEFPEIKSAGNLKALDLTGNKLQYLEEKMFGKTFHQLERLTLSFNNLSRIENGTFMNLRILKALYLNSNQLQSLPNGWSSSMELLQTVTLEKNEFNTYEDISLNGTQFQNIALSYSLRNENILYCTLRHGLNSNCLFPREYTNDQGNLSYKKKFMTVKMIDGKLKLIPSAEM